MDVGRPFEAPADELDPELERGFRAPHHLRLVEADAVVEFLDVGEGGFADSDRSDLLGFDQPDPVARGQLRDQPGSRHPASGSAADDHDFDGLSHQ
jgi:hypothetical protein